MLLDLVYWGKEIVAGHRVEELPTDCLANFWLEMGERKRAEINALNHTGALLVEFKTRHPKQKEVRYKQWLPYNDGEKTNPMLPADLIEIINSLELPPAMMLDLYRNNLIPPPKR